MFGQPNKPIFAPPARSKATIPPRPPSPPMVPPPSPTVAPLLWNRGTSVRPPGNPSAAAASQTHTKPTAFPNPVPHNRCEVSMLLPPPPPRCFKKKKKRESAHNTTQVHSCLAYTLIWWRTVLPFFLHDKPMCSQETSCTDNTIEHWTEFNHPRSPCKQGVMCSNTSNTAHMKFTHTPHTQLHSFTLFLLRIRKTLCTDKRPSAHTDVHPSLQMEGATSASA